MRILHLVSSSLFSGALPPTLALALAQRQAGATVYCQIDTWRPPWSPYEEHATPVVAPYQLAAPGLDIALSAKAPLWRQWQDGVLLSKWLKDNKPQIVHVHLSHDHNLVHWAGLPKDVALIRSIHSDRPLHRLWDRRWLLPACHGIAVRCKAHQQAARQSCHRASVQVFPSSLPQGVFTPARDQQQSEARAALHLPQEAFLVGMAALLHQRGQERLIMALPRLPPHCHAVFAGEGPDKAQWVALAQRLGISDRVHWLGYVKGEVALQQLYHSLDMVLWLAPGNDAGLRPILEAMASGLPILGRAHPLVEGFGLEQCGRLLPDSDPSPMAIATGVMWLMGSPAEARRRGWVGADWIRYTRTTQKEAQATLAWYEQVYGGLRRSPRPTRAVAQQGHTSLQS